MSATTRSNAASVERRIKRFYEHFNRGEFEQCHQMIDPRIRQNTASVTLLNYTQALRNFCDRVGRLDVRRIHLTLHLEEPSTLYEGRDFAIGQADCKDEQGTEHVFRERWVREGRVWYTRSTGMLVSGAKT